MDAALAQVKRLADTVSPLNRPGVILDLMKVVHSLETPEDMLQRVGAMVRKRRGGYVFCLIR